MSEPVCSFRSDIVPCWTAFAFKTKKITMLDSQSMIHGRSNQVLRKSSLKRNEFCASSGNACVSEKLSLSRTKSLFSIESQAKIAQDNVNPHHNYLQCFGTDIRRHTGDNSASFDGRELRSVLEPHLRVARLRRMNSRGEEHRDKMIASSAGVPYVSLRTERPFLFDTYSHPMHEILAQTLGTQNLSKLHEHAIQDKRELLLPLLDPELRQSFHHSYDKFVTTFCIPLLHTYAMNHQLLQNTSSMASSKIVYRYQAFPSIQVVRPGEGSQGPSCGTIDGHSIGFLTFHIPLTPATGTNALYTESQVGREDWHPLATKSVGLGYLFDGARCLHYTLDNTTSATRVSLEFRVALYREDCSTNILGERDLCSRNLLQDSFSARPGYYEEAVVETGRRVSTMQQFMARKRTHRLLEPDSRVGFPFV